MMKKKYLLIWDVHINVMYCILFGLFKNVSSIPYGSEIDIVECGDSVAEIRAAVNNSKQRILKIARERAFSIEGDYDVSLNLKIQHF